MPHVSEGVPLGCQDTKYTKDSSPRLAALPRTTETRSPRRFSVRVRQPGSEKATGYRKRKVPLNCQALSAPPVQVIPPLFERASASHPRIPPTRLNICPHPARCHLASRQIRRRPRDLKCLRCGEARSEWIASEWWTIHSQPFRRHFRVSAFSPQFDVYSHWNLVGVTNERESLAILWQHPQRTS
jgi:hypothetical protein